MVLVYGRVHPGSIKQKWPRSLRPKYEAHSLWSSHWGNCFSPFLQHNTKGPISVMAGYISAPFGRVHPGPREWQMEHTIMAQRYKGAACNLNKKGRSWYLAKYRRANPKKGRSWYLRSTDGQTPKRKELIFEKYRRPNPKKEGVDIWEVQMTKPQKRKELIFEKYRRTKLRMERTDL